MRAAQHWLTSLSLRSCALGQLVGLSTDALKGACVTADSDQWPMSDTWINLQQNGSVTVTVHLSCSITLWLSWRLKLTLLWLWTDWHMPSFTRYCKNTRQERWTTLRVFCCKFTQVAWVLPAQNYQNRTWCGRVNENIKGWHFLCIAMYNKTVGRY